MCMRNRGVQKKYTNSKSTFNFLVAFVFQIAKYKSWAFWSREMRFLVGTNKSDLMGAMGKQQQKCVFCLSRTRWAELDGVDVHKAQQTGIVSGVLLLPIATLPPHSSNPDSCNWIHDWIVFSILMCPHPTYNYIIAKPSTIHILSASFHEISKLVMLGFLLN